MSINIDNLLSKIKEREVLPENEVKIICDKVINIISLFYIGKVNFYKGRTIFDLLPFSTEIIYKAKIKIAI